MDREHWFFCEMRSTAAAISAARDQFVEWLEAQTVGAELSEEMAVVISELSANAVSAAATDDEQIEIRAWREHSTLVVEVENSKASIVGGVVFHNDTDPLRGYGQGLLIVTAYTDSVEVISPQDDGGLIVRCRKAISPA